MTRFAPLPPGSTIGVIGGGQLGRMMAMAAARLGFDVCVLVREPDGPAGRVAAKTVVGAYDDAEAIRAVAEQSDVLTFEFENVRAEGIAALEAEGFRVAPSARALAVAQDRLEEKTFLNAHGVPTVDFVPVNAPSDIAAGLERLGAPALLKTRREGYDGKGQVWVADVSEAQAAFERLRGAPAILEAKAEFAREVSIIAARGADGRLAAYPLAENTHEHGILRRSIAPAEAAPALAAEARRMAADLLEALDYVGVLGLELFETKGARLLANEFAPRVHNSGHWTLDGCEVDQFEQHIRAIAGWPLGPTDPFASVEMLNLLGDEVLDWAELSADPSARLWIYGKRDPAPGRKMGHVNRLGPLPR